jgi:hypothetical protein
MARFAGVSLSSGRFDSFQGLQNIMDEKDYSLALLDLLSPRGIPKGKEASLKWIQDFVKQNPGKYDNKLIARMKQVRMKRPEWIPMDAWVPKKKSFDTKGEIICQLAACGLSPTEISKRLEMNYDTIAEYLKAPLMKKRIYEIQEKMFGGDPRKLFRSALQEAFNTEIELMRTSKRDTVKLNAAQDLLDRAAGKAPQEINVNESNIRNMIERLDKLERTNGFQAIEVPSAEVTDAEFSEVDKVEEHSVSIPITHAEPLDPVDKWLKENAKCLSGSSGNNP